MSERRRPTRLTRAIYRVLFFSFQEHEAGGFEAVIDADEEDDPIFTDEAIESTARWLAERHLRFRP